MGRSSILGSARFKETNKPARYGLKKSSRVCVRVCVCVCICNNQSINGFGQLTIHSSSLVVNPSCLHKHPAGKNGASNPCALHFDCKPPVRRTATILSLSLSPYKKQHPLKGKENGLVSIGLSARSEKPTYLELRAVQADISKDICRLRPPPTASFTCTAR